MEPEDIPNFILQMSYLSFFELGTLAASWVFLKLAFGVRTLDVYTFIQTEYGFIQMSEQLFIIENMFCSLAVACAMDFTFR